MVRHSVATRRDLTPLFEPASVAVVGASDDPVKWGNWLARGALRGASRRAVYLVNRRGGEVMGTRAHRALAELPEPPELTVLAVPPTALEAAMDDAIAVGTRAVVVITAGSADGDAGGDRDIALASRAREAGVILLGPNCLGIFDGAAGLELVPNNLPRGSIGLLSQSGNLALEIGALAQAVGLGFSRFVSLGNQADLDVAELVAELGEHDGTELIAIYIEDFRDGRAFARAAEAAVRAGALRGRGPRGTVPHGRPRQRGHRNRRCLRGRRDAPGERAAGARRSGSGAARCRVAARPAPGCPDRRRWQRRHRRRARGRRWPRAPGAQRQSASDAKGRASAYRRSREPDRHRRRWRERHPQL
jgi:predicted CoA-binding protein